MDTPRIRLRTRYEVEHELGAGAMGTVYLARDLLIDRRVVLKTLQRTSPVAGAGAGRERSRLLEEARSAGRISHPNVVTVYDIVDDLDTDRLYLALEYVDGEPLDRLLRRERRLSVEEAIDIAVQVAAGLQHLHDAGIIHRDIKPSNILLDSRGRVKITDFGIARAAGGSQFEEDGSVFGTPPYMAPEQLRDRPVDARSDVFSLGSVLYEMLSGKRAFEGGSLSEIAQNTLQGNIKPLIEMAPFVPPLVAEVVDRALRCEQTERPPSVTAMAEELLRAAGRPRSLAGTGAITPRFSSAEPPPPAGDQTRLMIQTRWRRWLHQLARAVRKPSRPLIWVLVPALTLVLSIAGGWWLREWIREEPVAELSSERTYYEQQLIGEGLRLLEDGEARGAAALFALAERVSDVPERAGELRERAEAAAEELVLPTTAPEPEPPAPPVRRATRRVLDAGDSSAAVLEVRDMLADSGSRDNVEDVLTRLEGLFFGPSESAAPSDEGRIELELQTELPRGTLVVYAAERQVVREDFDFTRRRGLFGREHVAGELNTAFEVPPGAIALRVMVVPRGQAARVALQTVELAGGQERRLLVRQASAGAPTLTWW